MATYTIRTRNTGNDPWTDRYQIDDPLGVLDILEASAPCVQTLVSAGENQIEVILEPLNTRKLFIEKLV